MSLRRPWLCGAPLAIGLAALASTAVKAEDHFLTIGGGYTPSGNQASLEKNVLFFQHVLGDLHLESAPHEIFFSDGDSPERDVQFLDTAAEIPRVNLLLARVFGKEDDLGVQYRTHEVPGVRGASSPRNLDHWFDDVGRRLQPGDRLIVYLTGHGGKGTDAQNPHFFMWNRKQIPVKDFVARLDKLDPRVRVVLVMVQCYSGGFANCIFNEGDPKKGISPANRCGFYATVHNRPAAGCTPDVDEENYQEYSSSFWSAMCGRSRIGQPVDPPDFDRDGHISFLEAHAFTVLTSNTIDIPVKTSDALLRAFSKTKADDMPDLVTADAPFDTLQELATPIDRAVLVGLSQSLDLSDTERTAAARSLAVQLEKERGAATQERKKLERDFQRARSAIAETLKLRWPELDNPWHPRVAEEVRKEGSQIVAAIEGHGQYKEFSQLHDRIAERANHALDLERRWVKCQRFVHVAETVALAANLTKVASQEIQDRYQALVASESGTLCAADALPAGN